MNKLVLSIRNLKLSIRLTMIIAFTCLALLILELAGRQTVYKAYDEQLYQKTIQVCIAYASQLETEISKMENISFSVIGDASIQERLVAMKNSEQAYWTQKSEVTESLTSFKNLLGKSFELAIYLTNEQWLSTNISVKPLEAYVGNAKENKGRTSIFVQDDMVGVYREIRQISGLSMEHLGVLFVLADLNTLMRDIGYNYEKTSVMPDVFVFDGNTCIYNSNTSQEVPVYADEVVETEEELYVPYVSQKLGWSFMLRVPYDAINGSIRRADFESTLLCVLMAILICVVSSFLVYSLLPHVNLLLRKFEQFSMGIMPTEMEYPSYEGRTDEFGKLHVKFDRMALEYQKLTQQSYENMVLLKDAQFQSLQAQIRPHFLFNTLSTIVWTASDNGDTETAQIADALGRILRGSMDNTKRFVTISDELDLVRDYLYIQDIRYAGRLKVTELVDEDVKQALIPSFTIQPIVENVIVHVVEKTLDECYIRLIGRRIGDEVELVVEDNGGDLDEHILDKLETGEVTPKGNGIGLNNVATRIKIAFSVDCGLRILSEHGKSQVMFRIPYVTEESKLQPKKKSAKEGTSKEPNGGDETKE